LRSPNADLEDNLVTRFVHPGKIMFCNTGRGILDESYPGYLRDATGLKGWYAASNSEHIHSVLVFSYWYRKFGANYKMKEFIESGIEAFGFKYAKRCIEQTLHTVNGLLMKLFLAFPGELPSYEKIADHTASLFIGLMRSYFEPTSYTAGVLDLPENQAYSDIKDFLNFCKSSFHKDTWGVRVSWLDYQFKSREVGRFFGTCLKRLKHFVAGAKDSGMDYTESPAWIYRCSIIAQTRVLGYLPIALAEYKRRQFRETISRVPEPHDKERADLIRLAVHKRLYAAMKPGEFFPGNETEGIKEQLIESVSAINFTLKPSASVDSMVSEGGKLEDARKILALARKHRWKIPIRDLDDGHIIEHITLPDTFDVESELPEWGRPLFWLSFQLVINFWIECEMLDDESLYYQFPLGKGKYYTEDIMRASVVHISEPGKERNLTKSTSTYAWFLTPGSKVTQTVLSRLDEHKVGLISSAHGWAHEKRISSESDESAWIYDPITRRVRAEVRQVFKDWLESTDFIGKSVGWNHLEALLDFISFPRLYGKLIKLTILLPQPVHEVVLHTLNSATGKFETSLEKWEGFISEGYMMGNPITKTILHLIHVSETEVSKQFLINSGYTIDESKQALFSVREQIIDRKVVEDTKETSLAVTA
jgi:hypothetical protein